MDPVKALIEHAVFPMMERVKGNRIREYTRCLQATQNAAPEELRALQARSLAVLLKECVTEVPAYKQLAGIVEIESDPFGALSLFPVLTKAQYRQEPARYLSGKSSFETLLHTHTGGSTAEPVNISYDRVTVEHYEAARWRGLSWHGITPGSRSVMIWGNYFELSKLESRKNRLKERWLKNRFAISASGMDPEMVAENVVRIRRFKPEYIYGYATALYTFARLMEKSGLRLGLRLKAVLSTSETLFDYQRELIERVFECRTVNEYGAKDGGILAYECPKGHMHISAENAVLEVVDPVSFKPLPAGEVGLLLVTDLHNLVMPRLRYVLGDMAALSEGSCDCGLTLPLLKSIDGRADEMLVTVDGKLVHGVSFNLASSKYKGAKLFQIVQKSPALAELSIVREDGATDADLENYISRIQFLLPGTELRVRYCDSIPMAKSGKYRYAIREFPLEL